MGGVSDPFDLLVASAARRRFGPAAAYEARNRRLVTPGGAVADLSRLRRLLDREPRWRWPAGIERHLEAVALAEAEVSGSSLTSFRTVRTRLGLRAEPGRPVPGRVGLAVGPDLTAAAVVALDHVTVPVTGRWCRAWGVSPARVTALAAAATRNQPRNRLEHQVAIAATGGRETAATGGRELATFVALTGGPFTSGLVIDPALYRARGARSPTLVAVPDDYTLVAVTPSEPGPTGLTRWAELLVSLISGSTRSALRTVAHHQRGPTAPETTAIWAYRPATGLAMFNIYVTRYDDHLQ